jgi:hypothetical protein
MKRAYDNIGNDRNIPGLRVCNYGCNDERDPYRLPARQPEKISIRFPRPDADIAANQDSLMTDPNVANNVKQDPTLPSTAGEWEISPESPIETPINGDLDNLSP